MAALNRVATIVVGIGAFLMSWEKPFEFAEGDSGVTSPIIKQWNQIHAEAKVREIVPLSLDDFMAEVLEFARDKSHSGDARAKAYGLVWQMGLQRAQEEPANE